MLFALALASLACAVVPASLFLVNLCTYREPPPASAGDALPPVSVLIPARDEERAIARAVQHVLRSRDVVFEVIVMDDASTDGTAAVVAGLAQGDSRVRLEQAPALPRGWNGKQHACWALAHAARYPVLCFVDADVRLHPDALARMSTFLGGSGAALVSGFPRQLTETPMEWLLLPLIHFVLLGFLPMPGMRATTRPGYAAGCGQFLMARREPYLETGGHAAIRETMHDGLRLPRLFREHGLRTDLADLTTLATCRMYTTTAEVWQGLAKNATEGLAAPARILPITLVLLLGQVVPFAWLVGVFLSRSRVARGFQIAVLAAMFAALLPRLVAVRRFRQPVRSALLHPLGILLLLVLQWYALVRKLRGGAVRWRSRAYAGQ